MAAGGADEIWRALGALQQQATSGDRRVSEIADRVSELEGRVHTTTTQQALMAQQVQVMAGKVDTIAATMDEIRADTRAAAEIGAELKRIKNRFAWAGLIGFGGIVVVMMLMGGAVINKISAAIPALAEKELRK